MRFVNWLSELEIGSGVRTNLVREVEVDSH